MGDPPQGQVLNALVVHQHLGMQVYESTLGMQPCSEGLPLPGAQVVGSRMAEATRAE